MINNYIDLKFFGINPSAATQKYIYEKFSNSLKEAPFGTTYKINLSKKDFIFKVVVIITSSAREYIAVAHGSTLDEALKKSTAQIKKKFQRIKCPRFHRNRFQHTFWAA